MLLLRLLPFLCLGSLLHAQAPSNLLPIVHQFPVGTKDEGDFRDRLCRLFASEVERQTNGALKFDVQGGGKNIKPDQQYDAVRGGTAPFCLISVVTWSQKIPELNVALLPGLIPSYTQAEKWRGAKIGAELTAAFERAGVKPLTWAWTGGAVAATTKPIIVPEDARAMRVRGVGKYVDALLTAVGAIPSNMASNEINPAVKAGKLDGVITTSSSLLAFGLADTCRAVTTPRDRALCFLPHILVVSKPFFDALPPDQRRIIAETALKLDKFALDASRADDQKLAEVFLSRNAFVADLDDEKFERWQHLARIVAWREFERSVPSGPALLKLAQDLR